MHLSYLIAVNLHYANAKSAAATSCIVPRNLALVREGFHDERNRSCHAIYAVYKTASITSAISAADIVSAPWIESADDLYDENASQALIKASSWSLPPTCLWTAQA